MENLNLSFNSAFQDNTNTGGGRFTTMPFSRVTFTPTSPSGHLMVPGSPAAQIASPNLRVVPTITRSQSSSNLPENLTENLYDEVGGGFSSRVNHRIPKKSCSQWDMVGASSKKNHLEVKHKTYTSVHQISLHTALLTFGVFWSTNVQKRPVVVEILVTLINGNRNYCAAVSCFDKALDSYILGGTK